MSYKLRPYQEEAVQRCTDFFLNGKPGKNGLAVLPTGCHGVGTLVLMADGTEKPVQQVREGERVCGPDGGPRVVLGLCRGRDTLYRIVPLRGEPFVVNGDHMLALICTNEGKKGRKGQSRFYYKKGGEQDFITVRDYLAKAKYWQHLRKLHRATTIEFQDVAAVALPLPPWIVGVLLGDGYSGAGGVSITSADEEIIRDVKAFAHAWWLDVRVAEKKNNKAVSLMITKHGRAKHRMQPNPLRVVLRSLNMDGVTGAQKSIPAIYKTASADDRLELLAGLLDTDGHFSKGCVGWVGGSFDYVSKSETLARDVVFVARSLGFYASIRSCRKGCQTGAVGTYYRVHISGCLEQIPCRIKRKQAPIRESKKNPLVSGFSVEPIGEGEFFGFELDGDHLYLTADFTVHHNSGKSLVIANTVANLDAPALVFQPSKEILEQNLSKFHSYGIRPSVYSASMGRKTIGDITLATIGSVAGTKNRRSKAHLFQDFPYVFLDECDGANAKGGQYKSFFEELDNVKLIGCSATPWRMHNDSFGTMAKFLTRTRPRLFHEVCHYTQVQEMVENGYWAKLEYKKVSGFDRHAVRANSTGKDFDERALQLHFFEIGFQDRIVKVVERLQSQRKNALIFTRFVKEAIYVANKVPGIVVVTADTSVAERAAIGREFRAGKIWGVINVGIFLTGFDYPELETVVLARPTKSLRVMYQTCGRGVRIHPAKESCWIVDMVGLTDEFGQLEDFKLYCEGESKWAMFGRPGGPDEPEQQLTNAYLEEKGASRCPRCGSGAGFFMRHIDTKNSSRIQFPPVGVEPNVRRRYVEGKTYYEIAKATDSPDAPAPEYVMHNRVCGREQHA